MGILKGVLRFFVPLERTLLFTTFEQEQYIKIKSALIAAGISHRSKIKGGSRDLNRRADFGGKQMLQYDIFVSKKDEHGAQKALF